MGMGQPPARRTYAPEGAHRAGCIEQGDLKPKYQSSDYEPSATSYELFYLSSVICILTSVIWYLGSEV